MTYFRYEAKDLFGHVPTQRTHLLRMALLAAIGARAMEGRVPLSRDALSTAPRGSISFYPNEGFMPRAPRITVTFIDHNLVDELPARAVLEVEYTGFTHRREPLDIDVVFPDRLLGFGRLIGAALPDDRYPNLCFNLTPGEVSGNLYDPLASICAAYSITEASYDQDGTAARLDSEKQGRFPSTYQALN